MPVVNVEKPGNHNEHEQHTGQQPVRGPQGAHRGIGKRRDGKGRSGRRGVELVTASLAGRH